MILTWRVDEIIKFSLETFVSFLMSWESSMDPQRFRLFMFLLRRLRLDYRCPWLQSSSVCDRGSVEKREHGSWSTSQYESWTWHPLDNRRQTVVAEEVTLFGDAQLTIDQLLYLYCASMGLCNVASVSHEEQRCKKQGSGQNALIKNSSVRIHVRYWWYWQLKWRKLVRGCSAVWPCTCRRKRPVDVTILTNSCDVCVVWTVRTTTDTYSCKSFHFVSAWGSGRVSQRETTLWEYMMWRVADFTNCDLICLIYFDPQSKANQQCGPSPLSDEWSWRSSFRVIIRR